MGFMGHGHEDHLDHDYEAICPACGGRGYGCRCDAEECRRGPHHPCERCDCSGTVYTMCTAEDPCPECQEAEAFWSDRGAA